MRTQAFRRWYLAAGLLGLAVMLVGARPAVAAKPVADKAIVEANTAFGLDLYHQLVKGNPDGNAFFSPYSVSSALLMTWEGARGRTATQMADVLGLTEALPKDWERPRIHQEFGALNKRFNEPSEHFKLSVANALWLEKTLPFSENFLRTLSGSYDAGLHQMDFRGAPGASGGRINGWVEKKTNNLIKNLLPPGSVTADTRLVLTNAIYFKGDWVSAFKERNTRPQPFTTLAGGPRKDVTMMQQQSNFAFGDFRKDKFKALVMPYQGGRLSMLVLLPDEPKGLAKLEQKLSYENLAAWTKQMRRQLVNVKFPKFKLETKYGLIPYLRNLGMTDAFVQGVADFTGLTESGEGRDLGITGVFHKAFVDVNEEGTEAAAATGVVIGRKSAAIRPPKVYQFHADRPFVFVIQDNQTGSILFMGRMTNPPKAEKKD